MKEVMKIVVILMLAIASHEMFSMEHPNKTDQQEESPGILEESDKHVENLFLGIKSENVDLVRSALAFGISPFVKQSGTTALQKAQQKGNVEIIQLLSNTGKAEKLIIRDSTEADARVDMRVAQDIQFDPETGLTPIRILTPPVLLNLMDGVLQINGGEAKAADQPSEERPARFIFPYLRQQGRDRDLAREGMERPLWSDLDNPNDSV